MKKLYLAITLLIAITMISLGISVWALLVRQPTVLVPDYALPEADRNAETIPNESGDRAPREENSGNVSLHYSDQVMIDLADNVVHFYFANPKQSNHDMMLQIVIQDEIIAQSGLLISGHRITQMELTDDVKKRLSPGGYDGKFVIYYYDPVSNERSMVNTEIPIHIAVSEK